MLFIILFFSSLDGDDDDRGGSNSKSSVELFNAKELAIPMPRLTNTILFKHENHISCNEKKKRRSFSSFLYMYIISYCMSHTIQS